MLKKIDGYLLINSINHKFIVKIRVFPVAKTEDMKDYRKPTKRNFDPDLCIFLAGTNSLSLDKPDPGGKIATDVIDVAESLKSAHSKVAVLAIVPRLDNFKEKTAEVNKCIVWKCWEKDIPLISHDYIIPKRHLNKSKLHFNNYGNGVFVRNLKEFLNKYQWLKYFRATDNVTFSNEVAEIHKRKIENSKNTIIGDLNINSLRNKFIFSQDLLQILISF